MEKMIFNLDLQAGNDFSLDEGEKIETRLKVAKIKSLTVKSIDKT
jgi:hypothetical protein